MSNITITEVIELIEAIKITKISEPIKITKVTEVMEIIEQIKTTCTCESCKTDITLETAISCDLCDEDEMSHLFCKECTLWCDACEKAQGCKECIKKKVCWECDYNMCYECLNSDVDCGCFGECYSCGKDVDRGSDGWPCLECEKWYCRGCRESDNNPCKDCCSEEESE